MNGEYVVVMDCGSTNITVTAVRPNGEIVATSSTPNSPVQQEDGEEGWLVFDMEPLWQKISSCTREVCDEVGAENVKAVTLTTWGADGAPVDADGYLTYPPICWQCPRTEQTAKEVSEKVGARRLFDITGYQVITFNTLFRLIWLRQNAPGALDKAEQWLMMPGLLSYKLSGQKSIDATSASTMMAMDLKNRTWSEELLAEAGLDPSFFPEMVYPGEVIGEVTNEASAQTGLKAGTPVVAAGHDTQFAPIGSGATRDEAILSSGTWEILMARAPQFQANDVGFSEGLIIEQDAVRDLYDPQLLMMGSGVLEWVREKMFSEVEDRETAYETMVEEARGVKAGADGVTMVPSFVPDTGPTKKFNTKGTLTGLTLSSTRGHVYRATLEGLTFQMKDALRILESATGFSADSIRVVGGGARNPLWNRIRADVSQMPVTVTREKEATVLGASVAAWVGAGKFSSFEEGQEALDIDTTVIEPSENAEEYQELFEEYKSLPPTLQDFYSE